MDFDNVLLTFLLVLFILFGKGKKFLPYNILKQKRAVEVLTSDNTFLIVSKVLFFKLYFLYTFVI